MKSNLAYTRKYQVQSNLEHNLTSQVRLVLKFWCLTISKTVQQIVKVVLNYSPTLDMNNFHAKIYSKIEHIYIKNAVKKRKAHFIPKIYLS